MTSPVNRIGCIVIVAVGAINECFAATAIGTPIECPPPNTIDTVGFDKDDIISAKASPASTSPPTVLSKITTPSIFGFRSEEHTSELQSRGQLVCRLLLEKKKEEHTSE